MEKFEYSFKTAHPHAQALMAADFYWDPGAESGPFGNNNGMDAPQAFRQWRLVNISGNPIDFLKDLIIEWQYPHFDWYEMDTAKIEEYLLLKPDYDEQGMQQKIQQFREALKQLPDFSYGPLTDEQIRQVFILGARQMGGFYLIRQDNAIIGTAFAQFVLEGKIDHELKELSITAIKRQLLPVLINSNPEEFIEQRKEALTKMMTVINMVK
jgi:uncharacterized protein YfeS